MTKQEEQQPKILAPLQPKNGFINLLSIRMSSSASRCSANQAISLFFEHFTFK